MGIFLCFTAALFWSFFDVSRKLTLKKINEISLILFFVLFQSIIFLFLRLSDNENNFENVELFTEIILIFLNLYSSILFLKAIKNGDLSLSIPILSFTPFFSAFFSYIFLGEKLSISQYFGFFLLVIGTVILFSSRENDNRLNISIKSILTYPTVYKLLLVAFIWGTIPVLDKKCINGIGVYNHGLIQSAGVLILIIFFYFKEIIPSVKIFRKEIVSVSICLFFGTLAIIIQYFAILITYVSIMEAIKRTIGQFGSIFFGNFFFNETINKSKILGIFLMSVGVIFILLIKF